MKSKCTIILFFLTIIMLQSLINIPEDYPTIQQGIDASIMGDTILVQPGTYFENINFNGHNVSVASLFLTTGDSTYIETTIIDGSNNGNVVIFQNGESPFARLIGFTITHGLAELFWNYNYGAGIRCTYSDPVILNCLVKENNALGYGKGGGIFCSYSCAEFRNVIIEDNYANQTGGGIQINNTSHIVLDNVSITNNTSMWGGGLYIYGDSNPELSRVKIINNVASNEGGGIICHVNCNPVLTNLTIFGNNAPSGGGIFIGSNCFVDITNTILWNNSNEIDINGGSVNITYSNIEGGYTGNGNINEDPLFIDPQNLSFHLTEQSPCIDAGDPDSPLDPDGTISDIGRYYFYQNLEADFEAFPLIGYVSLDVQFTDTSSGNIVNWEWDFNNDGIIDSYTQNPSFLYTTPGNYTISLTVYDGQDQDTVIKENYITVNNVEAMFDATPTNGYSPLEVEFSDLSLGNITSWEWDFNNDGIIDSYLQDPIFTYNSVGVFSVKLTVYCGNYSNSHLISDFITTYEHVDCDFSGTPISGQAPLYVHFTDLSSGIISQRLWDFNNDGFIDSNDPNPICCYEESGLFSVYLYVSDGVENDFELKNDYINVTATNVCNLNIPNKTRLNSCYPNPFNPISHISFDVKNDENALLDIFNAKGQLILSSHFNPGHHVFIWNAEKQGSGIYFVKLKSDTCNETIKVIYLK